MQTLEISFAVERVTGQDGRQWVTVQLQGGMPLHIGYITAKGDAVAAHGTGDGWPEIDVRADPTRALGAVIGAWGRQIAEDPGDDDDE